MPQANGTRRALEVLIFPESMREVGEGHYQWDLQPNSTMTNGNVEQVVTGVDGRDPLNVRKATLASVLARAAPGLRLNEHLEADGPDVFHHACKLGLEGIVSKRKDSRYRSGRSPDWVKSKTPDAPAVKRLAEEEWGRWSAAKPRRSSR